MIQKWGQVPPEKFVEGQVPPEKFVWGQVLPPKSVLTEDTIKEILRNMPPEQRETYLEALKDLPVVQRMLEQIPENSLEEFINSKDSFNYYAYRNTEAEEASDEEFKEYLETHPGSLNHIPEKRLDKIYPPVPPNNKNEPEAPNPFSFKNLFPIERNWKEIKDYITNNNIAAEAPTPNNKNVYPEPLVNNLELKNTVQNWTEEDWEKYKGITPNPNPNPPGYSPSDEENSAAAYFHDLDTFKKSRWGNQDFTKEHFTAAQDKYDKDWNESYKPGAYMAGGAALGGLLGNRFGGSPLASILGAGLGGYAGNVFGKDIHKWFNKPAALIENPPPPENIEQVQPPMYIAPNSKTQMADHAMMPWYMSSVKQTTEAPLKIDNKYKTVTASLLKELWI